jgi:hypothetical protein
MQIPTSPDGRYHYFVSVMYGKQHTIGVASIGYATESPVLADGIDDISAIVKGKLGRDDAIVTAITPFAAPSTDRARRGLLWPARRRVVDPAGC